MEALLHFLPQVWFVILGLFLFLYVLLDGFDLGVGILSLSSSDEKRRTMLMTSLGNVWDANETWLVLMAGALFGAFPLAFGTILNALYLPLMLMVVGLILRAVAFEFREHSNRKAFWNQAFGVGSFIASLFQGFTLGGLLAGIKVDAAGHFAGGMWDWLSWNSILMALTLVQGYVLIGSTYLILKTEGELQDTHFRTAKLAAWTTLIGAVLITITTPLVYENARARLFHQPQVYIFAMIPVLGVLLVWLLQQSLTNKQEVPSFVYTALIFLLTFIGLGFIAFPYIIPPTVTIYQAASSPSAMVFMITFIGFLIPIMLFYNIYNYFVFRGKVVSSEHD
jgi:cytochrome d ubiquinol oxidase subunit II